MSSVAAPGTVTFTDVGASTLCSGVALSGNTAACTTTTTLALGQQLVTASFALAGGAAPTASLSYLVKTADTVMVSCTPGSGSTACRSPARRRSPRA